MPRASFWIQPPSVIADGVDAHLAAIQQECATFAADLAREAQVQAKLTHPFRNVTGRAERGFAGTVATDGRTYWRAVLMQRDPERAGLEYWHAGRWATIQPVMRRLAPRVRRFLQSLGRGR